MVNLYGMGEGRRRRLTPGGAALGLALFVVLVATMFVLVMIISRTMGSREVVDSLAGRPATTATISQSADERSSAADDNSAGSGSASSTAEGATLVRPRAVSASSVLDPTSTNNYRPTNLVDGDLATAWNEGAEGNGVGQWVRFDFSEPIVLARIEIANGYQKDTERFEGNVRARSIKLEYSNGGTQLVELIDTQGFQAVTALRGTAEWLKLTIVSVYPAYIWEDASLSEVRIYEAADQ